MTSPGMEIRSAFRALRRAPLFTAVAVLTLGLGVGANTAVFSVVREVLLRPLAFEDPGRLVEVQAYPLANPDAPWEFSWPNFMDLRSQATAFAGVAAWPRTRPRHVLEIGDVAGTAEVSWVSGDFFTLLGREAALGRTIRPADDVENAPRVAVLSDQAWRGRFGGTRDVIGRVIRLNGERHTIVGVMPPRVTFPPNVEIWTALRPELNGIAENRDLGFLTVMGRLAPGVPTERASADAAEIVGRLAKTYSPGYEIGARVRPLRDVLFGPARPVLLLLSGAAALVLLLACANVANLMLARAAASRREHAVRAALGAGRGRLVVQPLLQSLLLAIAGGAAGMWIAWAVIRAFAARLPDDLYRSGQVTVDPVVLGFGAGVTLLAALLFAAAPALQAADSAAMQRTVTGATRGAPARRLSRAIMAAQLALATLVLVAGALIVRSFVALNRVDTGFADDATLTMSVFLPPDASPDQATVASFFDRLIERTRALPGVADAAGVLLRPLEGPDGYDYPFSIEGRTAGEQTTYPFLNYEAVTPGYFSTVGLPLLSGRRFTDADDADAPGVVIISRTIADRFFSGEDAIGRRIKWGPPDGPAPWLTIVGVTGEARYRGLSQTTLDVYVPYRQSSWSLNYFVVRSRIPLATVVPAIRATIRGIHPAARAVQVATLRDLVDRTLERPRFNTLLLGSFAGLAVILAAAGVFGVIGYITAWRTAEVGVRMAVGATRRDIARLILGDALGTAAIGIGLGTVAAWTCARLLDDLLFAVPSRDPLTFATVALGLAAVTIGASWLPARRATTLEPVAILRSEGG